MKRIALAALGALAISTSAMAGGSIKDREAPISWTGFYLGATAGMGSLDSRWFVPGGVSTPSENDQGFIFGATAGYGMRSGIWVFGIEGDWSAMDVEAGPMVGCNTNCVTSAEWLATVRGRVGVLVGPATLLYATAGAAWAEIKGRNNESGSHSETASGWTWGGGFETKLNSHWSVKGEYLRVELDDTIVCPGGVGNCNAPNIHSDTKLDVLRAGLNYKF